MTTFLPLLMAVNLLPFCVLALPTKEGETVRIEELPELDLSCGRNLAPAVSPFHGLVSLDRYRLNVSKDERGFALMGYEAQEQYLISNLYDYFDPAQTRIGSEVVVDLLPSDRFQKERLVGRVIGTWATGFDMVDYGSGQVRKVSTDTMVFAFYLKPNFIRWQIPRDLFEFNQIVRGAANLFVVLSVRTDSKGRAGILAEPVRFSGRLSLARYRDSIVYVIENDFGVRHVIDPDRLVGNFGGAFVASVNGKIAAELSISSQEVELLKKIETDADKEADQRSHGLFNNYVYTPGTSFLRPSSAGLGPVDIEILLLSPSRLKALSLGTVVWDWMGERYVVGEDLLDFEAKKDLDGMTGFGFLPGQNFIERQLPAGVVPLNRKPKAKP